MIDKNKVLQKINGLDLFYANQNHKKIEYFIENGNPSQYYLKLICDMANVPLEDVQSENDTPLSKKQITARNKRSNDFRRSVGCVVPNESVEKSFKKAMVNSPAFRNSLK